MIGIAPFTLLLVVAGPRRVLPVAHSIEMKLLTEMYLRDLTGFLAHRTSYMYIATPLPKEFFGGEAFVCMCMSVRYGLAPIPPRSIC